MDKITLVSKGASLSISDEKLLIEFDRDMNSLSTALWAGGYRSIRSALNQKLTGYYESLQDFPGGSVESYLKICAEEVTESPEKCPSLLTAARVRLYSHKVLSAGGMTIEAVTTGGVEKTACRASSPALYREEDEHFFPVGTINMMIIASGFLPEGVMARALITLTEENPLPFRTLGSLMSITAFLQQEHAQTALPSSVIQKGKNTRMPDLFPSWALFFQRPPMSRSGTA
jgi:adenosylcobinamide hydrolase